MDFLDVVLHFDGSCLNNPGGPGGWGFVVETADGRTLAKGRGLIPNGGNSVTNNTAEWRGLIEGVKWLAFAQTLQIDTLTIRGDSQLVINQASDRWKCKKSHLQALYNELQTALEQLDAGDIRFQWIPREQNTDADALSTASY